VALAAVVLPVATLIFLTSGSYIRSARVSGRLVPIEGEIAVVAPSDGTLTSALREEGASVAKGQVIARIAIDRFDPTGAAVQETFKGHLARQRSMLEETLRLQVASANGMEKAAESALRVLDSQRVEVRRKRKNAIAMLEDQKNLLSRLVSLSEARYVSAVQVQQQKAATLELENLVSDLALQEADIAMQSVRQQEALASARLGRDRARNERAIQNADIAQRLDEASSRGHLGLIAPVAGLVTNTHARVGHHVSAGEVLYTVVPASALLEAEVLIPAAARGLIREGATVKLHYSAFPYQEFGVQQGEIAGIAQAALTSMQASAALGRQTSEPFYRARIKLRRQSVRVGDEDRPLIAGMAVEAEVPLQRRKILRLQRGAPAITRAAGMEAFR